MYCNFLFQHFPHISTTYLTFQLKDNYFLTNISAQDSSFTFPPSICDLLPNNWTKYFKQQKMTILFATLNQHFNQTFSSTMKIHDHIVIFSNLLYQISKLQNLLKGSVMFKFQSRTYLRKRYFESLFMNNIWVLSQVGEKSWLISFWRLKIKKYKEKCTICNKILVLFLTNGRRKSNLSALFWKFGGRNGWLLLSTLFCWKKTID